MFACLRTIASPALVAGLVLLSACAGQPMHPAPIPGDESGRQVQHLTHWYAAGKIALRSATEAQSARFQWRQHNEQINVKLNGPMGLQATDISSDGLSMTIRRGKEVRHLDVSSRSAIIDATGWDLPLPALPYWLRGLPLENSALQGITYNGNTPYPFSLQQEGWTVQYERYEQFDGMDLPTRLRIQRGATSARIIINDWQFDKP